jgi:hypothetical protein
MTNELIERLSNPSWSDCSCHHIMAEAAAEIERLQAERDLLGDKTFSVHHNPNCPSPFQVRLVGELGVIDHRHPAVSCDVIGHGQTFAEAALAALKGNSHDQ